MLVSYVLAPIEAQPGNIPCTSQIFEHHMSAIKPIGPSLCQFKNLALPRTDAAGSTLARTSVLSIIDLLFVRTLLVCTMLVTDFVEDGCD